MALGSVQDALARVCRSIEASESISMVIGPPGTGKSLLCNLVAERFASTHEVVVLGATRLEDRKSFFRHLLHQLNVDFASIRDGDLQLAVIDRVYQDSTPQGGLLIIVDEAQSLSPDVLESIRMVTNVMRRGVPRVSAVVCGGVKLDDVLAEASLEPFTQRVSTRCYLHPLNGEETRHYIRETIRSCGADPDATINNDAIATIHHACSGVPRLINQLMTQAIDCAEEADQSLITEPIIDLAWSQLQQLPGPMLEAPLVIDETSSVEFGELEEREPIARANDRMVRQAQEQKAARKTLELDDIVIEEGTELWFDDVPSIAASGDDEVNLEDEQASVESAHDWDECDGEVMEETVAADESVFGDFEHEETIAIGSGVNRQSRSKSEPVADFEFALHEEIIGLNNYLSDILDPATGLNSPLDSSDVTDDGEFDTNLELETDHSAFNVDEQRTPTRQILPIEVDDCQESDLGTDSAHCDDSDLLVIEDEIELRRIDGVKRYDSLEKTISVDFQAMLSRMRSGSSE